MKFCLDTSPIKKKKLIAEKLDDSKPNIIALMKGMEKQFSTLVQIIGAVLLVGKGQVHGESSTPNLEPAKIQP